MLGSMKRFNKTRFSDIIVEVPVFSKEQELEHYCFNDPALNGFSEYLSNDRADKTNYKIINKLKTKTLEIILNEKLKIGQSIDFLSVYVDNRQ